MALGQIAGLDIRWAIVGHGWIERLGGGGDGRHGAQSGHAAGHGFDALGDGLGELGSGAVARLFLADRTQVAEFDAGTEEVTELIKTATARAGASDAAWDRALASHSAAERAAATVYTLDV